MRAGASDWASRRGHVPVPILAALALILPIGPGGWVLGRENPQRHTPPTTTLAQIAERAGCRLTEFRDGMNTNPPVTGRFVERARAGDGAYVGKRPPSLDATTHAMFHGRVLFQYRPTLPAPE